MEKVQRRASKQKRGEMSYEDPALPITELVNSGET